MVMDVIGFSPRPSQAEVFASKARFLVIDAGRRWGKSLTGLNWLLQGVCDEGGVHWWVAPVYAQSKMAFRQMELAAKRGGAEQLLRKSLSELRWEFPNGAVMEFKSADNPDNLRGSGLKRVVIDEAARVRRDVWEEVIRPAVSDTHGRVMFISTPKGKNYFYELWTRGQDALQPEYWSPKPLPSTDNPMISEQDIEQARRSLPADVFAQEYMAEFLENQAGVFRGIRECARSVRMGPVPGEVYYAGLDLARLTDFTVLTILDSAGRQVYLDRYNTLDWAVQKRRIIEAVREYGARLLIDSTGIGDPIYDDLRRAGLAVSGYKFTSVSKKQLIEALMLAFEQRQISILDDPVQRGELEVFEYTLSPGSGGQVHYSAPAGYHDDCVIALALAWWARSASPGLRVWSLA